MHRKDIVINKKSRHLHVNFTPPPFEPIAGHGLPLRVFAITRTRTTLGRTPLDEWSARHRDLYLTTQNTHMRKIPCPGGIRTHYPGQRAAADTRLRPRGHWDRLNVKMFKLIFNFRIPKASLYSIYFSRTRPTYRSYCEKHIPTKGCP